VYVNPQIVRRREGVDEEEGCLSLPGLYAPVHRARRIKIRAFDLNGGLIEADLEDLASRAFQHELDHLDGKLFIDYLTPAQRRTIEPKLEEIVALTRAREQGEVVSASEAKPEDVQA
jgi:peptide deformylase